IDYKITNPSAHDVYVFSPFLQEPFDGELKRSNASEVLWMTFSPKFKGNYFTSLEFMRIAAGQSYIGHINSRYAAQRLNNCTTLHRMSIRLVIGWAYNKEHAQNEWEKDNSETIRIVQRW